MEISILIKENIKTLQDFCDIKGFPATERINIISEILIVMIKGYIDKS